MEFGGSRISGLGAYRPARVVTSAELAGVTGVTGEWIEERTGIRQRHFAAPNEEVVDMAIVAGTKAIADAGLALADIDLVMLATSTRYQLAPAGAPQVASGIGLPNAGAFDMNAVCAGFTYGLTMASAAVRSGQARHILVIGSDKLSTMVSPEITDTYVIFADGAGAAVVSACPEEQIGLSTWGSDGTRHDVITSRRFPDGRLLATMDGPLVYRWATSAMPAAAEAACARFGVTLGDIDWFVPHQANERILKTLSRRLGFAEDRVVWDVVNTGNTSSASIPLALSTLRETGRTVPGELVLLLGFGAGLSHAGMVVRMP